VRAQTVAIFFVNFGQRVARISGKIPGLTSGPPHGIAVRPQSPSAVLIKNLRASARSETRRSFVGLIALTRFVVALLVYALSK
jgi:hypothetical protein